MELVEGEDLSQGIARGRFLSMSIADRATLSTKSVGLRDVRQGMFVGLALASHVRDLAALEDAAE
jgi:hypothetical protein